MEVFKFAILIMLALPAGALAQGETTTKPASDYGFQLGTVGGFADFVAPHINSISGVNPGFAGGAEFGVHKYIGVFSQFGYSRLTRTPCIGVTCLGLVGNYYEFGGGVEFIATNHTRFVPYGRVGMTYEHATGAAVEISGNTILGAGTGVSNEPAVIAGGGLKVYINHHFGIDGGVSVLRSVGSGSSLMTIAPTVGVFFQSK